MERITKLVWKARFTRWRDVFTYGLVGGLSASVATPYIHDATLNSEDALSVIVLERQATILLFGAIVLLCLLARRRLYHFVRSPARQMRNWLCYPTIHVSVVIGMCVVFVFDKDQTEIARYAISDYASRYDSRTWIVLAISCFAALFMCRAAMNMIHRAKSLRHDRGLKLLPDPPQDHAWQPVDLEQFEAIRRWINSDIEISHPSNDVFGQHTLVADRISRRLIGTHGLKSPSIILIGARGSGKSTIAKLVEHRLEQASKDERGVRILMVRISLWGYETSAAASSGILESIRHRISSVASTLAIAGIPSKYVSVVGNASGRAGELFRLFEGESNPDVVLRTIDSILLAVGYRLVVWIEDLERFGLGLDANDPAHDTEFEARVGPLRALLYRLDNLECVSTVSADAALRPCFDHDKSSRFIEYVDKLSSEEVWRVVATVRKACLELWPHIGLHCGSPEWESQNEIPTDRNMYGFVIPSATDPPTWRSAVVGLLPHPRLLKHALRGVIDTWHRLAGEIDLEDLICLNVLRAGDPEVYAWIIERGNDLSDCGRPTGEVLKGSESFTKSILVESEYARLFAARASESRHWSGVIVARLFPVATSVVGDARMASLRQLDRERPQGIASRASPDRLRMLLTEQRDNGCVSDQSILALIRQWRAAEYVLDEHTHDLVAGPMHINRFAGQIRHHEWIKVFLSRCEWYEVAKGSLLWMHEDLSLTGIRQNFLETGGERAVLLQAAHEYMRLGRVDRIPVLVAIGMAAAGSAPNHPDGLKQVFANALRLIMRRNEDGSILAALAEGHPDVIARLRGIIGDAAAADGTSLWNRCLSMVVACIDERPTYVCAIVAWCFDWNSSSATTSHQSCEVAATALSGMWDRIARATAQKLDWAEVAQWASTESRLKTMRNCILTGGGL